MLSKIMCVLLLLVLDVFHNVCCDDAVVRHELGRAQLGYHVPRW